MIYNASTDLSVTRVTLDGIDITKRCFFADDQAGYVAIYEIDETGHIIADDSGDPIPHGKIGKVLVEL